MDDIESENNILCVNTPKTFEIDYITLQQMTFLYNAIETGWKVKKEKDSYVFTKKHNGKKEIYKNSFLKSFIKDNLNVKNIE